jgi:hypothetical protein
VDEYRSEATTGKILFFEAGAYFDGVVGDATRAYGKRLLRFHRYVAFVKPDLFLVLDDLAADTPRTFDWLAHSYGDIAIDERQVTITKGKASLLIRTLLPADVTWRLERTPPDTNGEPLLKHLVLRPDGKRASVLFLNAMVVGRDQKTLSNLEVTETEQSVSVGFSTSRGRSIVVFDTQAQRISFETEEEM